MAATWKEDLRRGFLRSAAVIAATLVLSTVCVLYVGAAAQSGVTSDLELWVTLSISFLTGFGLCGLAEDADAGSATVATRRALWPRTSDWASIIAVALTFLWTSGKAAHSR